MDYTFSAWSKPVSSVSLHLPELKAGVRYRLYANFINTKTKGEHSINYEFDPYDYYD